MTDRIHIARRAVHAIGVAVVAFAPRAAHAGSKPQFASLEPSVGATYVVHDTTIDAAFDAAGVAATIQQAHSARS
jgi:hypothetical protein